MIRLLTILMMAVMCRSTYAQTYMTLNYNIPYSLKIQPLHTYTDGSTNSFYCEGNIHVTRAAGEDETCTVAVTMTISMVGTLTSTYNGYWSPQGEVNGSIMDYSWYSVAASNASTGWPAWGNLRNTDQAIAFTVNREPGLYTLQLTNICGYGVGPLNASMQVNVAGTQPEDPGEPPDTVYTGPDVSWWDNFKTWLASLLTMTTEEQAKWADVKNALMTWGPVPYYSGIGSQLSSLTTEGTITQKDIDSSFVGIKYPTDVNGLTHYTWAGGIGSYKFDIENGKYVWDRGGTPGEQELFPGHDSYPTVLNWMRTLFSGMVYLMFGILVLRKVMPYIVRSL